MRPVLSTTGPLWSMVASSRCQSSAGSTFMMQRYPVNATRRGAPSCRSRRVLATGAAGGMWAIRRRPVERAAASIAAAGAMQELRHPFAKCLHPSGNPLARPSVHPRWLRGCCAPTPPADVTSAWEGPVATHARPPPPSPLSASLADMVRAAQASPVHSSSETELWARARANDPLFRVLS